MINRLWTPKPFLGQQATVRPGFCPPVFHLYPSGKRHLFMPARGLWPRGLGGDASRRNTASPCRASHSLIHKRRNSSSGPSLQQGAPAVRMPTGTGDPSWIPWQEGGTRCQSPDGCCAIRSRGLFGMPRSSAPAAADISHRSDLADGRYTARIRILVHSGCASHSGRTRTGIFSPPETAFLSASP